MSFVTLLALGIAAFVVAPLLAHRLRRLRADERPFAAAHLVPPAQPRARRKAKLEDRALFGVRAAAVVALALLGASPLVRCSRLSLSRSSGASMAVVIVIDDSMSMRVATGASTRFARAKQSALDLLASTREGDAVGVVLAGSPVRVALAPTTDTTAVMPVVESLTPSDRGTDLDGALRVADSLLAGLPQVDKRIVLLSDLADGRTDAPALGAGLQLPLWTPLADLATDASDCAILSADDVGGRVRVRLACSKDVSAAGRKVEVRLGDRVMGTATAGQSMEVLVDLSDPTTGDRTAHLLGSDAIATDDAAPVLVASTGSLGVVVESVDETAVTGGRPVVEQALDALRTDLATRPLPAVPDQAVDFTGLSGLIVDDPPGFTPEQRRALEAYLEGGGVVLLALGPRAAAAQLGASLAPILSHATQWKQTTVKGTAPDASTEVLGESTRSLVDLGASRRTLLSPDDVAAVVPLVRWSDGAPLIARKTSDRGEAYVVTLPFGLDASDLPLRPAFLSLLDVFVATVHAHAAPRRSEVGSTWTVPASVSGVVGPSGPVEVVRDGGRATIVPAVIGAYQVKADAREELRVASPVAAEVDMRPRRVAARGDAAHLGATQAQVDISSYIAMALLMLMLSEVALRLHHRRQTAEVVG